jgi:hypothetical protein
MNPEEPKPVRAEDDSNIRLETLDALGRLKRARERSAELLRRLTRQETKQDKHEEA